MMSTKGEKSAADSEGSTTPAGTPLSTSQGKSGGDSRRENAGPKEPESRMLTALAAGQGSGSGLDIGQVLRLARVIYELAMPSLMVLFINYSSRLNKVSFTLMTIILTCLETLRDSARHESTDSRPNFDLNFGSNFDLNKAGGKVDNC